MFLRYNFNLAVAIRLKDETHKDTCLDTQHLGIEGPSIIVAVAVLILVTLTHSMPIGKEPLNSLFLVQHVSEFRDTFLDHLTVALGHDLPFHVL